MARPNLGMCFARTFPPRTVLEVAERLERGGVDQLWVIEDCFYTAGISLAASALARTERLTVGIGILPAVARNPAITAMELATLAELAPGRVIAGIGHGVQDWMDQMGARTASPLATLDEVVTVVRRLLRGERVTFDGRQVHLRDVQLEQPPAIVPPVLAGVRGPRSLALAGRVADGIVLAEGVGPAAVRWSLEQAGSPDPFRVSVFSALCITSVRETAYRIMAPFVASILASANPGTAGHPHAADLAELYATKGVLGIETMPRSWWLDFGAIGTLDDVVEHVDGLAQAGAHDVALFPAAQIDVAFEQIDDVVRLAAALR
jgi:alkanesulfonate monooxygenase SsuD/methylene tetrahydromethanopterin reductase-like flavin-dependent oxidoreductase (luciferase family)